MFSEDGHLMKDSPTADTGRAGAGSVRAGGAAGAREQEAAEGAQGLAPGAERPADRARAQAGGFAAAAFPPPPGGRGAQPPSGRRERGMYLC
jgi:hypothetical protein